MGEFAKRVGRRDFIKTSTLASAGFVAMLGNNNLFAQGVPYAASSNNELLDPVASAEEVIKVMATNPKTEYSPERMAALMKLQDTHMRAVEARSQRGKDAALEEITVSYNSGIRASSDDYISDVIDRVNYSYSPKGIEVLTRKAQQYSGVISKSFKEAGEVTGVISDATEGRFPIYSEGVGAGGKIFSAIGWVAGKVPAQSSLATKENIATADTAIRAAMTEQFIKQNIAEKKKFPDEPTTLDLIMGNGDLESDPYFRVHVEPFLETVTTDPKELLADLDIPESAKKNLRDIYNNAQHPDSQYNNAQRRDSQKSKKTNPMLAQYESVLSDAMNGLKGDMTEQLELQRQIFRAELKKDAGQKAKLEKAQRKNQEARRKEQAEIDVSVYLLATVLGRTGSPKAAKLVNDSYEVYKRITSLPENPGAMVLTAGYVGIALFAMEAFSRGQNKGNSPEQQMMDAIHNMFKQLQKSIKELKDYNTERFDELSAGQKEMFNRFNELEILVSKVGNRNSEAIRAKLADIETTLFISLKKLENNEYSKYYASVEAYSRELEGKSYSTLNESQFDRVKNLLDFFCIQAISERAASNKVSLFTGTQDAWDSEIFGAELALQNLDNISHTVGLIPGIMDYLGRPSVKAIPSLEDWLEVTEILLKNTEIFPEVALKISTKSGPYLGKLKTQAEDINHTLREFLSEGTINAAVDRYKALASEIAQITTRDTYDGIVAKMFADSQGQTPPLDPTAYKDYIDNVLEKGWDRKLYPTEVLYSEDIKIKVKELHQSYAKEAVKDLEFRSFYNDQYDGTQEANTQIIPFPPGSEERTLFLSNVERAYADLAEAKEHDDHPTISEVNSDILQISKKMKRWEDAFASSKNLPQIERRGNLAKNLSVPSGERFFTAAQMRWLRSSLTWQPRKGVAGNPIFLNEEYKGGRNASKEMILKPGSKGWSTKLSEFDVKVMDRFDLGYDPLRAAQGYALISPPTKKEASSKPIVSSSLRHNGGFLEGAKVGYSNIVVAHYRSFEYKFIDGPSNLNGTTFRLTTSWLKGAGDIGARLEDYSRDLGSFQLTELHRAITPSYQNKTFGRNGPKNGKTLPFLQKLQKALYEQHNTKRAAYIEDSIALLRNEPKDAEDKGLLPTHYEQKRKDLAEKIADFEAISGVLRMIAGLGSITIGLSPEMGTSIARNDSEFIATKDGLIKEIEKLANPSNLQISKQGYPLSMKELVFDNLKEKLLKDVEAYRDKYLKGIELNQGYPGIIEIPQAVEGLAALQEIRSSQALSRGR